MFTMVQPESQPTVTAMGHPRPIIQEATVNLSPSLSLWMRIRRKRFVEQATYQLKQRILFLNHRLMLIQDISNTKHNLVAFVLSEKKAIRGDVHSIVTARMTRQPCFWPRLVIR
jgi:hypothetical protein